MSLLRETTMEGNPSKREGYAHFPISLTIELDLLINQVRISAKF